MDIRQQLEGLHGQYLEQEGENAQECVDALKQLHRAALRNAEDYQEFQETTPYICGGHYIPYLAWTELGQLIDGKDDRQYWLYLMQAFVESDFEEELQKKFKPLMVIYYTKERQFEIDRMEARVVHNAHPAVKDYYRRMRQFQEHNRLATTAYQQKFLLLKAYHPNFDLFGLPVPELEEYLNQARG